MVDGALMLGVLVLSLEHDASHNNTEDGTKEVDNDWTADVTSAQNVQNQILIEDGDWSFDGSQNHVLDRSKLSDNGALKTEAKRRVWIV